MQPLPQPLSSLIYASLGLSTAAVVLAALSIGDVPAIWIIPAAFILALPWHISILIIAGLEPHGSERIFSSITVIWSFFNATLWTGSFGVTLAFTILNIVNALRAQAVTARIWLLIAASVLAGAECAIGWWIAFACRGERKRITYAARWRPVQSHTSAQSWSIGRIK